MKSRDFVYWLQGVLEIGDVKSFDEKQTTLIRQHLALVFKHEIDPSVGSAEHQAELNEIHSPSVPQVTPESVEAAIKEALAKLPKPQGSHGPGPVMRC